MIQSWLGAIVHVERETCGSKLLATEHKLEGSREKHWKKSREFSCFRDTQNTGHIWRTVAFEVVVICQTGLPSLCVLLCNNGSTISGDVTLAVSMVYENICVYGKIPAAKVPSDGVYILSDGPCVLWHSDSQLAMLSTNSDMETMSLQCFSLDRVLTIDTTAQLNWRLNDIWLLGGDQTERNITVLTRATSGTSLQDDNPPKKLKTTDTNMLLSVVNISHKEQGPAVTKLEDNLVVHSDYASVISCVVEYDNYDPDLSSDRQRSSRYIVGTTYQQMLMFGDGKVLHYVSLKCVPHRITLCQLNCLDVFIVQDEAANVFVYVLKDSGFVFQGSWSNTFVVLVDDFVVNGDDQLLMVLSNPADECFNLSQFIITDLDTMEIPAISEDDKMDSEAQECASVASAVGALQKRLMHEKMVVDELQQETVQKKELLEKATSLLNCLESGQPYEWTNDTSLVPLLEPAGDHLPIVTAPSAIGSVDVLQTWQRIIDSQWIVGIAVVNNRNKSITEVAASLTCTDMMETKCVVFSDQPVEKLLPVQGVTNCPLSHGQTANIVCVTDLPVFTSDKTEASFLLCWKELTENGEEVRSRYTGHIRLTVGEVYDKSLCCSPPTAWSHPTTEQTRQDQMAYLITHHIIELEFKSLFTDLRRLQVLLERCAPEPDHIVIAADPATPTLAPSSSTPISPAVIVIVLNVDRQYACTNVLYRDTSRLTVLLQLLRGSLPTDITIEPVDNSWREVIYKCYQRLHRHLEHLVGLTDEQMKNGRCPLECEVCDPDVDYAVKDVMELPKKNI